MTPAGTDTHCPYCALQCAMTLTPSEEGVGVAARSFPTNKGGLCQKGWTSAEVLTLTDRITTPLLRGTSGELEPVSWAQAVAFVADRVRTLQAEHGRDAIGVFGGGGLTNEKAYQLGKFTRTVLRSRHIDYNGRFCMSSAAAAGNRAFGIDRGLPFPLADLSEAEAVLLLGSNVADTMPPLVQHLAGVRERGGLLVVDPRRSATAALAEDGAGIHLQPLPGTDQALLLGLLHLVVAEGLADEEYLAARVTGWDDVRRSVALWWPTRVASITGVPEEVLRRTVQVLAAASPTRGGGGAMVLTGRGAEQHTDGTDTVTAAINLALALGLPGSRASGYGCLTGQGNGQGGREHGQKADQLPGYRSIEDPAARAHVARVWGVEEATIPGKGVPAVQLLDKLGGEVRALFVHGANLLVSAPDATAVRRRVESLDLLVVCDFVPSETALLADVVLPVTQWAEEEGTMTSLEGRILRRRKAIDPPGKARSELEILADLAGLLGSEVHFDTEPALVFDELARASAGGVADYSGLSHARLDAETGPLHWPVPAGSGGTPRLFRDRFGHADGRARMVPVSPGGPADDLRPDAPLYLVTGRVLAQYQSGAQTRRVAALDRSAPGPFVELHPNLAARYGIDDGDDVRVTSARGAAVARARITTAIRPDTVFMPFHWSGAGMANAVTNDATDPVSGMPEFKVCAVEIARAAQPSEILEEVLA
ncbi:nitrite reductase [Nocardioides marmoriginsengisoli]|uniref:Nitrite reductase n=1 Tax=Nocardioides marmoriginsengisoli TaxID=661483 RepID=A0A3N0CJ15_9ACTN|nr:molybdopterin oxidoreductase family protein [Nocardioides marmoriginsengisoli]RNL63261.1 nitrite reductase [Nocardioides marmoriginsengisoli]